MSIRDFFADDCPEIARQTVVDIEKKTSCEIVFSMLPASSAYFYIDVFFGFLCSFIALCFLLFLPHEFHLASFVFEVLLFFVLGVLISRYAPSLKRFFLNDTKRSNDVTMRGKTLFYDLGISRTQDRNGILILFSIFEKKIVILPDIGVHEKEDLDFLKSLECKMNSSLAKGLRQNFFEQAKTLGDHLAQNFPIQADDVNELPDHMVRL